MGGGGDVSPILRKGGQANIFYFFSPEPEFVNVYGTQKLIPRNRFRKPM
jgi:hypothetical protein